MKTAHRNDVSGGENERSVIESIYRRRQEDSQHSPNPSPNTSINTNPTPNPSGVQAQRQEALTIPLTQMNPMAAYKCRDCDFSSPQREHFVNHVKRCSAALQMPSYKCQKCNYSAKNLSDLKIHAYVAHDICDICGFASSSKDDLMKHIGAVHLGKVNHGAVDLSSTVQNVTPRPPLAAILDAPSFQRNIAAPKKDQLQQQRRLRAVAQ